MPASSCYLDLSLNTNYKSVRCTETETETEHSSQMWTLCWCVTAPRACKLRTDKTTISVLMFEVERSLASLLNPPGEDRDKLSDVAGERADHGDAVIQHHVGITRQHGVWLGDHWEQ